MDNISETQAYENAAKQILEGKEEVSIDQLDQVAGGSNDLVMLVKYMKEYRNKGYCIFCKGQVAQPPQPTAASEHIKALHGFYY